MDSTGPIAADTRFLYRLTLVVNLLWLLFAVTLGWSAFDNRRWGIVGNTRVPDPMG